MEKKYTHIFSNAKIHAATGYEAAISLKDGLTELVRTWERDGLTEDPEKDALEDKLCAFAAEWEAAAKQL